MRPRARTFLVALLAAVVAVRVSASQSLTSAATRIAPDPEAAIRRALSGWTDLGTLGGASADGVRDLPLSLWFWLGDQVGLGASTLQTSWRAAVLVLAVLGAVRLARTIGNGRISGKRASEPWTPWVAAVLFGAGVVLVPVVTRSPLDGLAAATLPWIVTPLLAARPLTWSAAAGSAAWIGLAGVGSIPWAAASLAAGVLAAVSRLVRGELLPVARWLAFAAISSGWWIAIAAWEFTHSRDVTALLPDPTLHDVVADVFGTSTPIPFAVVVAVAVGPFLTAVLTLLVRPVGTERVFVGGLLVVALAALGAWSTGLWVPVAFAPAAGEPVAGIVGPVLGLVALAGLVSWVPLISHLGPRIHTVWEARAMPTSPGEGLTVVGGVVVVVLAIGGVATAAVERSSVEDTSDLEAQIAAWSREADPGRVLVLPARDGSVAGVGGPLGARPWVARDDLPTSGAGGTAALDDVVSRLSRGDGGPGTVSGLHRLGIAYVLVELGGPAAADRMHPTALVRAALAAQGATRVEVLTGVATGTADAEPVVDFGVRSATHQVEVWAVDDPSDGRLYVGDPVDVVGDAGSVSDLANAGVPDDRAFRLTDEPTTTPLAVSDSARRRDVDQRVPLDPYGPDLDVDQPRLVVPSDAAPVTTAVRRIDGAESVTASSSASDVHAERRRDGADALAAVDGNAFTAWQSEPGTGVGEWWQVDFDSARRLAGGTVQLARSSFEGNEATRVRVTTDAGSTDVDVPDDGLLALDMTEQTEKLRVTALAVNGETGPGDSIGIIEVTVPGTEVRGRLVVGGPEPSGWLLAARTGSAAQCVPAVPVGPSPSPSDLTTVCTRGVSVSGADAGSLHRVLDNPRAATVSGQAWVRAVGTEQAGMFADSLADPTVTATSSTVAAQDLQTRAQSAVDGDLSTAWRPSPEDAFPTLTLTWAEPAAVTGVRLTGLGGPTAATLTRVRVVTTVVDRDSDDVKTVTTESEVDDDGLVALPGDRTDQLTITFLEDSGETSTDSTIGGAHQIPIAVAEVELVGGPEVRYDADRVQSRPCGSGPVVTIAGKAVRTRIETSARAVVMGELIRAPLCKDAALPATEVDVSVTATFTWLPLGALLWQTNGALDVAEETAEEPPLSLALLQRMAGRGTLGLEVGDGRTERTLALSVPADAGWSARSGGGDVRPVVLDGWAQGWQIPAGDGRVQLVYPPAESLRTWSVAGAAGWGLVVLVGAVASVVSRLRSSRRGR